MKRFNFFLTVCFLLLSELCLAQVPEQFNYQAVARNAAGVALSTQSIKVRLSIRVNTASGPVSYSETRTTTTNAFGLFMITIGGSGASDITGSIATIDFYNAPHFLQVEIDINSGNNFTNMGTTQLLSVPYALQAQKANTADQLRLPFTASVTIPQPLINLKNTGSGSSMKLEIENNTSSSNVLEVRTNTTSAGNGIYAAKGLSGAPVSAGAVITAETSTGYPAIAGYSQNGNGLFGYSTDANGVFGVSNAGAMAGVRGMTNAPSGIGVFGFAQYTATGVQGFSTAGIAGNFQTSSGVALRTDGEVQITNTGVSRGRVLMTNASGDANWEGGIAFSTRALLSVMPVPNGTMMMLPFHSIDYNLGNHYISSSSLVNPNTFIAPVDGIYHFDATLLWEAFASNTGVASLILKVNDVQYFASRQSASTNRQSCILGCDVSLAAGDKVTLVAYQNSGITQSIPAELGSYFSGRFVMKN